MKYEKIKMFLAALALVSLFAFGQYIANQKTLTAFEKAIFPKALTEKSF
jgi:hypothetical protein